MAAAVAFPDLLSVQQRGKVGGQVRKSFVGRSVTLRVVSLCRISESVSHPVW